MIERIRWKYAEVHSKSRQTPHKNFAIDQGVVQLVIQTKLLAKNLYYH